MKYRVQWGTEDNVSNGIYDIHRVLKELQTCCYGECTEWEEKMWESIHIGDFIIELLEGKTIMVPYQGDGLVPEALIITPIKEN